MVGGCGVLVMLGGVRSHFYVNHNWGCNKRNSKDLRVFQAEYRDLPAELMEFASRIRRIELIGFAHWIRHFLPRITATCRCFTKMKNYKMYYRSARVQV